VVSLIRTIIGFPDPKVSVSGESKQLRNFAVLGSDFPPSPKNPVKIRTLLFSNYIYILISPLLFFGKILPLSPS